MNRNGLSTQHVTEKQATIRVQLTAYTQDINSYHVLRVEYRKLTWPFNIFNIYFQTDLENTISFQLIEFE